MSTQVTVASRIGRIANYVSFALSATFLGFLTIKRPDIVYVYHPPATVAFPAMVMSMLFRVPYVYDVQDIWPDTLRATGMITNDRLLSFVGWWCRVAYRHAARIVVLSEGFKRALINRGVPESRIAVISNWCDESQIKIAPKNRQLAEHLGLAGTFNLVFAGNMGKAQELEVIIEGALVAQRQFPQVRFVFVGSGVEVDHLQDLVRRYALSNVIFLPKRPMSEVSEILNLGDAFLVHLKKDTLFEITIPSKIQTYLAMGKPILAGVEGDAAELVENAGAGIVYSPGSSSTFLEALSRLCCMTPAEREEMGEKGRRFYAAELSLSVGVGRFDEVFHQVAL